MTFHLGEITIHVLSRDSRAPAQACVKLSVLGEIIIHMALPVLCPCPSPHCERLAKSLVDHSGMLPVLGQPHQLREPTRRGESAIVMRLDRSLESHSEHLALDFHARQDSAPLLLLQWQHKSSREPAQHHEFASPQAPSEHIEMAVQGAPLPCGSSLVRSLPLVPSTSARFAAAQVWVP